MDEADTKGLMRALGRYFETMVEIPRMRVGKRQTIETLINGEALILAAFLIDDRRVWVPRIARA